MACRNTVLKDPTVLARNEAHQVEGDLQPDRQAWKCLSCPKNELEVHLSAIHLAIDVI